MLRISRSDCFSHSSGLKSTKRIPYSDLYSLSSGCYFNMESLNVFRESPLSRHLYVDIGWRGHYSSSGYLCKNIQFVWAMPNQVDKIENDRSILIVGKLNKLWANTLLWIGYSHNIHHRVNPSTVFPETHSEFSQQW